MLHILYRGAASFSKCLLGNRSNLFTSICTALHQQKFDGIISTNLKTPSFSSNPHILNQTLFYSTFCCSAETLPEQIQISDVDKSKDPATLFKEWGCTESDISKIFERRPSLHKSDTRILQSKLEILSQLGITPTDLVKIVNCRPRFLNCRINILLNERLEYLETVFGSKELVLKTIVRNPSLLTYDLNNKIKPVIALYESLGIKKQDFVTVLLSRPTLIARTNLDDEKLEYIHKTGVAKESKIYKHVVSLFAISRIETIREKVANLEKFGLLEDEVLDLIGRSPLILTLSIDKVQRQMTFILGPLKFSASVVLRNPFLLYFNLERILKPRFQLACKIEDMGLVPQIKGPAFLTSFRMTEKRFTSAFITCHPKDIAKELVESYESAKSVKRLADSSRKSSSKGFPF